jgi:dTMP kinase
MISDSQGLLVVFEGIDGAGKSTLSRLVFEQLRAHAIDALLTQQPGGTPFGQDIRTLLKKYSSGLTPQAELLLFMADRAQHCAEVIEPALARKQIVLVDRYIYSSLAYQGYGRGLPHDLITQLNKWTTNGRTPDYSIYVRLEPAKARERILQRGEPLTQFEEHFPFLERVHQGFDQLLLHHPSTYVFDATQSSATLADAVTQLLLAAQGVS